MTTTKTHISTSGQRVPCKALSRPCPRGGHETITTGSKSEQGFQAAATRAAKPVRKNPNDKWARMTSDEQAAFLTKKHDEENVRSLVSITNETRDAKTLSNLANTTNPEVLTAVAKNKNTGPTTLQKIHTKTSDKTVRQALMENAKTPAAVRLYLETAAGYGKTKPKTDWDKVFANDQPLQIPAKLRNSVTSIVRDHKNINKFTVTHTSGKVFVVSTTPSRGNQAMGMWVSREDKEDFVATFGKHSETWKMSDNDTNADHLYHALDNPRFLNF